MNGSIDVTPELARRVRAARAYAGGLSLDVFAKRVGMGRQTLVRIESGDPAQVKRVRRMLLREMGAVAGLPVEFFTVDLARLADAPPSIAERLAAIEAMLRVSQPDDDRAEMERELEDRAGRSGMHAGDIEQAERDHLARGQ